MTARVLLVLLVAVALGSVLAGWPGRARAAEEVELGGRVVAVSGPTLTLDADGVVLTLNAGEVDPRFLQALRIGDDVRITAFRLADGSLLVYNVFLQPDRGPEVRESDDSDD